MDQFVTEQGPDVAAAVARMTDRKVVFDGEGVTIEAGLDGPTPCVVSDSGTVLDIAGEDDEAMRERAHTLRRFADVAARDRFLADQPWQERVRERGWATTREGPMGPFLKGALELRLAAGMMNSSANVRVGFDDGRGALRYSIDVRDSQDMMLPEPRRAPIERAFRVAASEWARFVNEVRLLGERNWRHYGANATDGLDWSYRRHSAVERVMAGGINAYPPDGEGCEPSPTFVRLLLAIERLIGRQFWPGFEIGEALARIPDPRHRVEHLLLHGLRAWASEFERTAGDPMAIREGTFEQQLVPLLARLVPTSRQVSVKGDLPSWPGVGGLDLELRAEWEQPTWVELKWAKTADTLHNCLWDAAKIGQAVRDGRAARGYIVAGAPEAEWRKRKPFARLFDVSCHKDCSLVFEHQSSWRGWYKENLATFPRSLPTPVFTVPVGWIHFSAPDGMLWLIRVARVEAPGSDSYDPADYLHVGSEGAMPGGDEALLHDLITPEQDRMRGEESIDDLLRRAGEARS